MYLPRDDLESLYVNLRKATHPSSSPVQILTALTVDSICATRILVSLFKRDFIPHKIQPVSGYADLQKFGQELVLPLTRQCGGDGGTVVCLGLGGAVALEEVLGLHGRTEDGDIVEGGMAEHGVEVWVIDSHRPYNLENVFGASAAAQEADGSLATRPGVHQGRIKSDAYKAGKGGVIVFDDGDLEEHLQAEKEAYFALQEMPEITEDDLALVADDEDDDEARQDEEDDPSNSGQKRKRSSDSDDEEDYVSDSDGEHGRPSRRRRSNSSNSVPIPSSPGGNPLSGQLDVTSTPPTMPSSPPKQKEPTARQKMKQLLKMRRKHEATLDRYYDIGTSGAEPVSSMMYSMASEVGRDENELLWLAIVGVSAMLLSPSGAGPRINLMRATLQDEVRRLNPVPESEILRSQSSEAIIPTTARSPTDNSIRLSPEPRFLLIRHWSLYDAMRHSPYLATRLHLWNDQGMKRLHKLLAKMGISLAEAGQGYLHMNTEVKQTLRKRILRWAAQYNLEGLVPGDNGARGMENWGFVRSWGWAGTLSAEDVAIVIGAILEVGTDHSLFPDLKYDNRPNTDFNYNARMRSLPTPPHSSDDGMDSGLLDSSADVPDYVTQRFYRAYDALEPRSGIKTLQKSIPAAQDLYRAILRVGSYLISKKVLRHLRSFRIGVIREGSDLQVFTHPGALVRLASWVAEAVAVLEAESGKKAGKHDALVLGALDENRSVYVVVGIGGGPGWNGSGKKIRSKAEIKEREEKKKRKEADRVAKKAAAARKREERRRLRRERNAANGLDSDDDENSESEPETEEEDSDSDADSDDEEMDARRKKTGPVNRFGQAFQEVVEQTAARVRIDSFEHSVVEVRKEDFSGFLEALSSKTVVS
ncbi:Putative CDC45 family protein [Septoria linicola]|uniref:CDC45 family protein n=1 Tax=Septoria linicola TaxID=215465 RepID=A0A9Q9ALH1_9PEZI|nr:putative CDC45 family protein [Septoria linicola]USW49163.1 Putative CDC45 family protein [Septoria linicola]